MTHPTDLTALPWRAPFYSAERTAYFEACMDRFAERGADCLVFTPPTTRGSLITRVEAWAINLQREYVPTLAEQGRWPSIKIGDHPDMMSREQRKWLSRTQNWGDCAYQWVAAGCPGVANVSSFADARGKRKKEEYAALVLKPFSDMEHSDRRKLAERRSQVEHAARQRL